MAYALIVFGAWVCACIGRTCDWARSYAGEGTLKEVFLTCLSVFLSAFAICTVSGWMAGLVINRMTFRPRFAFLVFAIGVIGVLSQLALARYFPSKPMFGELGKRSIPPFVVIHALASSFAVAAIVRAIGMHLTFPSDRYSFSQGAHQWSLLRMMSWITFVAIVMAWVRILFTFRMEVEKELLHVEWHLKWSTTLLAGLCVLGFIRGGVDRSFNPIDWSVLYCLVYPPVFLLAAPHHYLTMLLASRVFDSREVYLAWDPWVKKG